MHTYLLEDFASDKKDFWDTIWDIKSKNRSRITSVAVFGGGSRIRTGDPMLAKHVLYQLSYTPKRKKPVWWAGLVGTGRVELPTSTLSVWRSNQLS